MQRFACVVAVLDRNVQSIGQEFAHFERAELTACPDPKRFELLLQIKGFCRDQGEQKREVIDPSHPGEHVIAGTYQSGVQVCTTGADFD